MQARRHPGGPRDLEGGRVRTHVLADADLGSAHLLRRRRDAHTVRQPVAYRRPAQTHPSRLEARSGQMHCMVGQHGDQQVPRVPPVQPMPDRPQAQRRLQFPEGDVYFGQRPLGAQHPLHIPVRMAGAQHVGSRRRVRGGVLWLVGNVTASALPFSHWLATRLCFSISRPTSRCTFSK